MTGPFSSGKILVLPCDNEACINSRDRSVKLPIALGKSAGSAVRRVGHPGTPSDRPVEAAASPVEKQVGYLVPNRIAGHGEDIHRSRNVTDAAFLADSQIKAAGALKKTPRQFTRLGVY